MDGMLQSDWKNTKKKGKIPWKIMAAGSLMAMMMTGSSLTASAAGGLDIHTDYPGMTVKAGDSLTFNLGLDNSGAACDASLSVVSMPEGWEGYISGSGSRISQIHVPNGTSTATATFQVDVPAETADGTYEVVLEAKANDAVYDTLTLSLDVSQLEVSQGDFSSEYPEQEGMPGTTFSFNATLVNNSAATQSYSLSAESPDGWQVAFQPSGQTTQVASLELEPAASQGMTITVTPPNNNVSFDTPTIDVIEAGTTVEVTAHVTPSAQALTGDYVMTINADSSEVSDSAEFRVAVETSMVWGFVAVLVIGALAAGIAWIFRKYGRR